MIAEEIRRNYKFIPAIYNRKTFCYVPIEYFPPVHLSELPKYHFDFTVFIPTNTASTKAFVVGTRMVYCFPNAEEAEEVHDMLVAGMTVEDIIAYAKLLRDIKTIT